MSTIVTRFVHPRVGLGDQPFHPNLIGGRSPTATVHVPPRDDLYMVRWTMTPPAITAHGPNAIGVAAIAVGVTGTLGLIWLAATSTTKSKPKRRRLH